MIGVLDQFDFHHTLAQTGGVSLVYFSAPACGACKNLRRVLESSGQFSRYSVFEIDAQSEAALTNEFEVFHLPAMFLFNNGEFHSEIHAEPTPQAIIAAIESALAQPAAEAP